MIFIYMQAFMIFHLMTMTLALRNEKNKRLHIPTIQQFDIVVDNTNEVNPSYTIYSYSNEPPLHTYNIDDFTYIDTLDDEIILKDNNNCTACKNNNEVIEEIVNEDIDAPSDPKIIKENTNKHKIPYGEIIYSIYEDPLDLMFQDFILKNVECSKEQNATKDDKLQFGEIVYVADQETTDLVSPVYDGDNLKQENKELCQNMNPLINNDLDNGNYKEKDSVKDLSKSNAKSNSRKEKIKNMDDKDNRVCLFNFAGVVVLIVLNM